jgi:hypothetical protein
MKLTWESNANRGDILRVWGGTYSSFGQRDLGWQPGDVICKWQDKSSRGLVVSVIHGNDPKSTDHSVPYVELLVLWSRVPFDANQGSWHAQYVQLETLQAAYDRAHPIDADWVRRELDL